MEFKLDKLSDVNVDGDMFYDLTDGGYIKPEELLVDKELAQQVQDAADLVAQFLECLCDAVIDNNSEECDDE